MKNNFANEKLIVSGCSFTESPYHALVPPHEVLVDKTWPHRLGFKDENIINMGAGGQANDYIIDSVIKQLLVYDKKPDRIIIALTEWERFTDPFRQYNSYNGLLSKTHAEIDHQIETAEEKYIDDISTNHDHRPIRWLTKGAALVKEITNGEKWGVNSNFYWNLLNHTFHRIIILCELCKQRNIPLHILQLMPMFYLPPRDRDFENFLKISKMIKKSMDSNYYAKILLENYDEVDLVGFPWFEPMGGYHIWERVKVEGRKRFKPRDVKIGYEYQAAQDFIKEHGKEPSGRFLGHDHHPNELGHQLLADRILEEMII